MLGQHLLHLAAELVAVGDAQEDALDQLVGGRRVDHRVESARLGPVEAQLVHILARHVDDELCCRRRQLALVEEGEEGRLGRQIVRSEEHTSELQSLMRISSAVFCLKKKTK